MKSLFTSYPLVRRFALIVALFFSPLLLAQDHQVLFESLKIGDAVVRNVKVVKVTPLAVSITYDGGGSTLKRQELPPQLETLYPYDAKTAEEFQKKLDEGQQQRTAELQKRQEQANRELKASLLRQQQQAQTRLDQLQKESDALQKETVVLKKKARGRRTSSSERQDLDRARDQKLDYLRRIEEQKTLLDNIHKQLDHLP